MWKSQLCINSPQMEVVLQSINCSTSSGPDGIPSWILRDFAGVLGGPYVAVFNSSMCEGYVPEEWRAPNQPYSQY